MSSTPFDVSLFVSQVINASPFVLVAIAGAIMCMVRESRPRRVRVAVGCAVAINIGLNLLMPLVYSHFYWRFATATSGSEPVRMIVNVVSIALTVVSQGLLLYAAFTNDDRPAMT